MEDIGEQIKTNNFHTYYGGENGYDYCCFENDKIICSGDKEKMIKHASENKGVYVAILIPVTFTKNK
jgi:hypothetical protein